MTTSKRSGPGCTGSAVSTLESDLFQREREREREREMLLVDCLTSQQQASVSQGLVCPDNFTYCHIETEVTDPTFHLTQSQYTDTGCGSGRLNH